MRAPTLVAIALALAAGAAAWHWSDSDSAREKKADSSGASPTVSGPAARAKPVERLAAIAPKPPPRKTVFDELLATKDYAALYQRLNGTPEGATPKGRLVMYEVLRECATVKDAPFFAGQRFMARYKRDDFADTLAANDPRRDRRIAAYQQFTMNHCVGFPEVSLSWEQMQGFLREAANAGEPAARALLVENELWGSGRGMNASPSDAQVQALEQAAASRDPEAIRVAGRVMANAWKDYAPRIGPDEQPVEPRPFVNAFLVLACEYGAPCGADTPRMQHLCAFQGACDAQTFPEYLAYYGASPHDAEMLMQYRSIIRGAIESGDWSQLRVLRGQPLPSDRITFVPGPR